MSVPTPYIPPNALFTAVKASTLSVADVVQVGRLDVTESAGTVTLNSGVATVGGLALTANDQVFVVSGGAGVSGTGGSLCVSSLTTGYQSTGPSFTVKSTFAGDNSTVAWFVVGSPNFA